MPSKKAALILASALLNGCTAIDHSEMAIRGAATERCPTKDDATHDYLRAQQAYLRLSEKWRGKTIQRHEPGIDAALNQKGRHLASIHTQALRANPCLTGSIDWLLAFNNNGEISEIDLLWDSMNNPLLELELRREISNFRLLPIAAPMGSVYLLPVTFRTDLVSSSLTIRDFILR